jgi:hypothetical protein
MNWSGKLNGNGRLSAMPDLIYPAIKWGGADYAT